MKRIVPLFLIVCCLLSLTACSKDEIIGHYNQALQAIGDDALTGSGELQGRRRQGADSYVGTYEAEYEDFSGREILFGGTALEREGGNEVSISCDIDGEDGELTLLLQTGAEEPVVLCGAGRSYSGTVELPPASNYIIVEAEGFTGSLNLTVE